MHNKFVFFLILLIISVGGAGLMVTMRDVDRENFIDDFVEKSKSIGQDLVGGLVGTYSTFGVAVDKSIAVFGILTGDMSDLTDTMNAGFGLLNLIKPARYTDEQWAGMNGWERAWAIFVPINS